MQIKQLCVRLYSNELCALEVLIVGFVVTMATSFSIHLDSTVFSFLNEISHKNIIFDRLVCNLADNSLLKGGVIVSFIWWFWFRPKQHNHEKEHLASAVIASFAGLFIARCLAMALPFRLRPGYNPNLAYNLPYGVGFSLESWSSFPSDHATFFFALATGLLFVSRRAGIFALLYASIICLSRVYAGFHYPSDILAGAIIGSGVAYIIQFPRVRKLATNRILNWESKYPSAFYTFFFILTFQMAVLFDPIRQLAKGLFKYARIYI